eukprot:4685115-Alexandrium_andersonii.AAC.1
MSSPRPYVTRQGSMAPGVPSQGPRAEAMFASPSSPSAFRARPVGGQQRSANSASSRFKPGAPES